MFLLLTLSVNQLHKPSIRVSKPAYSEPIPEPGNRAECGRTGIQCKNTLGCRCMTWLALALICVAAAGHTVRGVSERGQAINQGPHQIQN